MKNLNRATFTLLLVFLFSSIFSQNISVWPGDVDNNGEVNCVDLLYVGAAFGETGAIRTNGSIQWQSQTLGTAWASTFLDNGENLGLADCDGNGIVDADDADIAIASNFGLTHSNGTNSPSGFGSGISGTDPEITLNPDKTIMNEGETLSIDIELGDASIDVSDFYGVAVIFSYDKPYIKSTSLPTFDQNANSFVDNGMNNSINHVHTDTTTQTVQFALTRTNQLNAATGFGTLGTLDFIIEDDILDPFVIDTMSISIDSIRLIDKEMNSHLVYLGSNTTIEVEINASARSSDSNNCPDTYEPVCGSNGITYQNACFARADGVENYTPGVCFGDCINPDQMDLYNIRECSTDYSPVCGCNNETYLNPCEAERAGVISYSPGVCDNASSCYDPMYVGTSGGIELNENTGELTMDCPPDIAPVCGCNGVTYNNACYAQASGITYYTTGSCDNVCVDPSKMDANPSCVNTYEPVCGCNGRTYSNACFADAAGVMSYTSGPCGSASSGGSGTGPWCNGACPIACGDFLANETNVGAGNDIEEYYWNTGTKYKAPDKIYVINKDQAGDLQIGLEIITPNINLDLFLLSGDCQNLTCIASSTQSNTSSNNEGIVFPNAPIGTYYIVVDGLLPSYQGDYKLEVSCGYLYCGDSHALTCGHPFNNNNNTGHDNVSLYTCSPNHINVENNGPEVVHHFTTTTTGNVDISLTNLSCNLELFLLSSCDRGACIEHSTKPGASDEHISTYLQPGTYYVVVDGYNGAACNYNLIVNCPTSCDLELDVSTTGSNCGQSTGSFTCTSSGGTPGYIVSWTGPVSGSFPTYLNSCTISNLPTGVYTVKKTDVNGCYDTKVVEIVDNGSQLWAQITTKDAYCSTKGSVTVAVTGGSAPYTIHLSGPVSGTATSTGSTFSINALTAGDYTVYIVDKNGCSVSKTFTIKQNNNNFEIDGYVDHAKCEQPGAIHIDVKNGCATYTVLVSGPVSGSATTNSSSFYIPNLPGGTYTVVVEDCNWCSDEMVFVIEDEDIDIDVVPESGICGKNGSLTVNVSNGNPNYIISWSGASSGTITTSNPSYTVTNLPSGNYSITVMDANWCSDYQVVAVDNSSSNLDVDVQVSDGLCENGSVWVEINDGEGPYAIEWDGPASGSATTVNNGYDIKDLPAGTYWINVTDKHGCTYMTEVTVNVYTSNINVSAWPNNGECGSLGSVELTISNGTAPYIITWDGAAIGATTSNSSMVIISDLVSGTYNFEIIDKFGCGAWVTVVIDNTGGKLDVTSTVWPGTCGNKGEVTVNIHDGCADYTIAWDGPISGSTTTSSTIYGINNAPSGTYTITVTDCKGCKKVIIQELNNDAGDLDISLNGSNPVCTTKGNLEVWIEGGNAPYAIVWTGCSSGNSNSTISSYNITNVCAGDYSVTVTGANGCSDSGTITIVDESTNINCTIDVVNGACGGTGSATLTFGTGTYAINWAGQESGSATSSNGTYTIADLPTGWYDLTISDSNGCQEIKGFEIMNMPSDIEIDLTIIDASCCNGGEALLNVTGGSGTYTYNWNPNVSTTNGIWDVAPGAYSVTVTDSQGCTAADIAIIGNNCNCPDIYAADTLFFPAGPDISICTSIPFLQSSAYDIILNGEPYVLPVKACDVDSLVSYAYFVLFGQGGAGPYHVDSWTVGGNVFSGTVNNMNDLADSMNVWDPTGGWFNDPMFSSITGGNASSGYGALEVTHIGSGVQSTMQTNFTGVALGFEIDIPDTTGYQTLIIQDTSTCCSDTVIICIEANCELELDLSHLDANCNTNGGIWVDIIGGTPDYDVSWTGPSSGSGSVFGSNYEILDLPEGSYTITVIDANKCVVSDNVYIDDAADLVVTATGGDASCGPNGTIWLDIAGGAGPYNIVWTGGGSAVTGDDSYEITGLAMGVYNVTITDTNGCKDEVLVTINDGGSNINITSVPVNANCNTPGSVDITIGGGTGPFLVDISGPVPSTGNTNTNSYSANNLSTGNYTVVVKDGNGCKGTHSFVIGDVGSNITVQANAPDAGCGDLGFIKLVLAGGVAPYSITWTGASNGTANSGTSDYTITGLNVGQYDIMVVDANGCSTQITSTINGSGGNLNATIFGTNGMCGSNGSFTVNVISGDPDFTITWNGATPGSIVTQQNKTVINDLASGSYSIQIEDSNGCTYHENVLINNNGNALSIGVTGTNGICGLGGEIAVGIVGGSPTYTVTLSGPTPSTQTTSNSTLIFDDLADGTYTVKVTDVNGCVDTEQIIIDNSASTLNVSATATYGSCGQTPNIILNISGGTPNYTVNWSGSETGTTTTNNPNLNIEDLSDGIYTITVSDSNGCSSTQSIEIVTLPGISLNVTASDAACNVSGNLWINIAGGSPVYTIDWSGPNGTGSIFNTSNQNEEISGLNPGTYVVVVTDNNGCNDVQTVTINGGSGNLDGSIMPSNSYCSVGGGIWINVFSGTAPYVIEWAGPQSGSYTTDLALYDISQLSPGSYSVTLSDATGCSIIKVLNIEENGIAGWDFEGSVIDASCSGSGSIGLVFAEGTPDYEIVWTGASSGSQTSSLNTFTIGNLRPGDYNVVVTESNGCASRTKSFVVGGSNTNAGFTTSTIAASCGAAGNITLNFNAGQGGQEISWTGPTSGNGTATGSSFVIPDLLPGSYILNVNSGDGCSSTETVLVGGSFALDIATTSNNGSCGNDDGSINVDINSGNPDYTISWSGPTSNSITTSSNTYNITDLPSGDYSITISDAGNCQQVITQTISNSSGNPFASFGYTGSNVDIAFINNSSSGTYFWDFGDGSISNAISPEHNFCEEGTYTVCLTVTNACGTDTYCEDLVISIPDDIVIIDVENASGASGSTICVPVIVTNCDLIVSFAGSLQVSDPDVCQIVGVTPGAISPTYFANNKTFNYYDNNGKGIEVKNGEILFCVEVMLTGTTGTMSTIDIVDDPLRVELGTIIDDVVTTMDHACLKGIVTVDASSRISGTVKTYWGEGIADTEMYISAPNYNEMQLTDEDGYYMEPSIPTGDMYTIEPERDFNDENGLSTYALFVGQRFILGMDPVEIVSPYQVIAGDANCSESFTTLDLFILQQLIIGTNDNLDFCPSWVFVNDNSTMPTDFDAYNVFPYLNYDNMMVMSDTVSNFVGVKVGDILGHANPHNFGEEDNGRSLGFLNLTAEEQSVKEGDIVEFEVKSDNFIDIVSYQFGLSFDFNSLEYVDLIPASNSKLASTAVGTNNAAKGDIRASWFSLDGKALTVNASEELLTIRFKAKTDLDNISSLFGIDSHNLISEAHNISLEKLDITLDFVEPATTSVGTVSDVSNFRLDQNTPNPFHDRTTITFELPNEMDAELIIHNNLGEVVLTKRELFKRGRNEISVTKQDLGTGVFHYTLKAGPFNKTRSMIIID